MQRPKAFPYRLSHLVACAVVSATLTVVRAGHDIIKGARDATREEVDRHRSDRDGAPADPIDLTARERDEGAAEPARPP